MEWSRAVRVGGIMKATIARREEKPEARGCAPASLSAGSWSNDTVGGFAGDAARCSGLIRDKRRRWRDG